MQAMILTEPRQPLQPMEIPIPTPNSQQVFIRVHACRDKMLWHYIQDDL